MSKKIIISISLIMLFVVGHSVWGYQKPEFSMPQRGGNSYNSGSLDWELPDGLTCEKPFPLNEMIHGMATWGELIYATGTNGSIFCVSKSGGLIFAEKIKEKPIGVPLVDENKVYVMTSKGLLMAFDRVNGKREWTINIAPSGVTDITRFGNLAVVGSLGGLHCIKITDGLRKWNITLPGNPQPVAIFDNRVIVNYLGGIKCVSLFSGKEIWDVKVPMNTNNPKFIGVPVIHFDRVFLATSDGKLMCFGLYNGNILWESGHGFSRAPPAVDGDRLWVPGGNHLVCQDIFDGHTIWDEQVAGTWSLWTQPIKTGNKLICAGKGDKIIVVSASDGSVVGEIPFIVGTSQELTAGTDYFAIVNNGRNNYLSVYQPKK